MATRTSSQIYEGNRKLCLHGTVNHFVGKVAVTKRSTEHNLSLTMRGCLTFVDKYVLGVISYGKKSFIVIFVKTFQNRGRDQVAI